MGNMSAMHGARQFVCLVAHCCMLDNSKVQAFFSSQHSYHELSNARDRGGYYYDFLLKQIIQQRIQECMNTYTLKLLNYTYYYYIQE